MRRPVNDTALDLRYDAVLRGLSFRGGDVLRARIKIQQSRTDDALHTEYSDLRVLERVPRGIQLSLEDPESDAELGRAGVR